MCLRGNNMQEKESREYKVDTDPAVLWQEHIMARMARNSSLEYIMAAMDRICYGYNGLIYYG